MDKNLDKTYKDGDDIAPHLEDSGEKMEQDSSDVSVVAVSEKSDSGREPGLDESTRHTPDSSGIEVGKESTASSELPLIPEHPDESTEAAARSDKSHNRKSIFTRAKGVAARGIQAVSRTLSPKKEPQSSPKGTSGSKGATLTSSGSEKAASPAIKKAAASGSKSPQKVWTKWKKSLMSGQKRRFEDEAILTGEDKEISSGDEATGQAAREGSTTRKANIVPGSSTNAPPPAEPMDTDRPGSSGGSSVTTDSQKRSRFAGLIDARRGGPLAEPYEVVYGWTSSPSERTSELEISSDCTEEMDIDAPTLKRKKPDASAKADVKPSSIKSIFTRAKGVAARGIEAVSRTLSPKKQSQVSPKGTSRSKGATMTSSGSEKSGSISPGIKKATASGSKSQEDEGKGGESFAGATAADDEEQIMQVDESSGEVDVEKDAKDDPPVDD